MKIIKSKSYMKKKAIWSDMPVGDPGLPGQLTERDIIGGPDEDISSMQEGSSRVGNHTIYYTYDYDYNINEATNIQPIKAIKNISGKIITGPYKLEILMENNGEQIKNDIERSEEDAKIERQPGYGQPDYDPIEY